MNTADVCSVHQNLLGWIAKPFPASDQFICFLPAMPVCVLLLSDHCGQTDPGWLVGRGRGKKSHALGKGGVIVVRIAASLWYWRISTQEDFSVTVRPEFPQGSDSKGIFSP